MAEGCDGTGEVGVLHISPSLLPSLPRSNSLSRLKFGFCSSRSSTNLALYLCHSRYSGFCSPRSSTAGFVSVRPLSASPFIDVVLVTLHLSRSPPVPPLMSPSGFPVLAQLPQVHIISIPLHLSLFLYLGRMGCRLVVRCLLSFSLDPSSLLLSQIPQSPSSLPLSRTLCLPHLSRSIDDSVSLISPFRSIHPSPSSLPLSPSSLPLYRSLRLPHLSLSLDPSVSPFSSSSLPLLSALVYPRAMMSLMLSAPVSPSLVYVMLMEMYAFVFAFMSSSDDLSWSELYCII